MMTNTDKDNKKTQMKPQQKIQGQSIINQLFAA